MVAIAGIYKNEERIGFVEYDNGKFTVQCDDSIVAYAGRRVIKYGGYPYRGRGKSAPNKIVEDINVVKITDKNIDMFEDFLPDGYRVKVMP